MPRLLAAMAVVSVLASGGLRLGLAAEREFDADEFQHLHAAWCVSQGLLPYRDFYEHHMPGLPLALGRTLPLETVGRTPADVSRVMRLARYAMWGCSVLALGLTWLIGRQLGAAVTGSRRLGASIDSGTALGATATVLLTFSIIFTGKGLEVRPDGPATVLFLLSLLQLIKALERPNRGRAAFFLSGMALGLALLFTQKLLMSGPGFAAIGLWWCFRRGSNRTVGCRVMDIVVQGVGVVLPITAAAGWFASQGASGAFLDATLLQNLGWTQETTAETTLRWLATRDPVLVALSSTGVIGLGVRVVGHQDPPTVVLLCVSASLIAGIFVIPAPYPQYLLPLLPLLAMFSASMLLEVNGSAPWRGLAAVTAAFAFCVAWAGPKFMTPWAYPALFASAALLAAALTRRQPAWAVATLLVALSLYQLQQLRWMRGLTNQRQEAAMAEVHRLTSGERKTVLDGFAGYGWFRMHAWRYQFLHPGVRARLSDADRQELVEGLRTGRIAPSAVLFDTHLKAISTEVTQTVRERFQPTGIVPVWRPRQRRSVPTARH